MLRKNNHTANGNGNGGDAPGKFDWDSIRTYLSVPVTEETVRLLNRLAASENVSVTEILRRLVEKAALEEVATS
jgi:hypothetical protein